MTCPNGKCRIEWAYGMELGWDRMGWDGKEYDGMGWDGIGLDGMRWDGVG